MTDLNPFIYALLGGILPAFVWLLFWLREDRKHPEPKGLITKTFLFGMLAVIAVLPFQKGVEMLLPHSIVKMLFLWAVLEELFKYIAGYFGGLSSGTYSATVSAAGHATTTFSGISVAGHMATMTLVLP